MQTKYNLKAPRGQDSDNRRVAETWAKLGFRVMPLRWQEETLKNGKVRKAKSPIWEGYATKATTDPKEIRRVWGKDPDLLVGLLTDDFTVVDLDRHGEKDGFAALEKMGTEVASDFVARTAGNGEHYIFANVQGVVSSNGGVAPGIDVKAKTANGVPSYIVAPGTITPWGRYEWIKGDAKALAGALKAGALSPVPDALRTYKRPSEPGQGEPTGLPFHVIRAALMACPNAGDAYASRDAWLHMVMAVHCETEGSEDGRELVHDWSKQHRDYDADHTNALWDSCKADRGLTGWHVIREAERHGWHDDAVTELRHMEALEDFDDLWDEMGWLPPEEEAKIAELVGGPVDCSGGLTFLSPSDCAATAARSYVIKGLLAQGDVAAIVGAPGAGKSLFAPRLGYAVAQGAEVFGRRVKAGGVFYVAAEDGHGMRGRVQAMEAELGDAPDFKVVEGVTDLLSKQGQLKALQRAVKERRPALVVIDTLAVAFPGLEENDAKGMGQVVAAARSLTKWGAAVVLIHHDTKAGDGLPRGHSLLNGALDVALYLKREDGVVSVKPSKNRNGTTEQELAFTVGVREIGTDEDGDAITAAICEEADNASRARGPKLSPSVQAALSVLRDLGKGTMHVPEETWRDACVEGRAVSGSDNVESRRKAFKRAVEDLTRKGVVILAEGKFVERYRDNEQFTEDFDDV